MSLAAWSSRLGVLTEDVKERIYNVLLFVDGGWMVDNRQVEQLSAITWRQMMRNKSIFFYPVLVWDRFAGEGPKCEILLGLFENGKEDQCCLSHKSSRRGKLNVFKCKSSNDNFGINYPVSDDHFFYSLFSQDSDQDSERSHQMTVLRSLCLPRLSFLLLSVLQNSSRHQEALRLADIISSDQHRLYQVTTPRL